MSKSRRAGSNQRAKRETADRKATSLAAKRNLRRLEVAEAIAAQGLTVEELTECIEMGSDFCWDAPLSRTAAIEYLNPQPTQSTAGDDQEQGQHQ